MTPKGARLATDEAILTFGMRAPPGGEREGDAWSDWYRLGNITTREVPEGTRATETSAGGPGTPTA